MSPGMCFLIGLSVPGADGGNAMISWPVEKERQSERRQNFQGTQGYWQERNFAANSHLDKEHTKRMGCMTMKCEPEHSTGVHTSRNGFPFPHQTGSPEDSHHFLYFTSLLHIHKEIWSHHPSGQVGPDLTPSRVHQDFWLTGKSRKMHCLQCLILPPCKSHSP